jgi:hypothetical protein
MNKTQVCIKQTGSTTRHFLQKKYFSKVRNFLFLCGCMDSTNSQFSIFGLGMKQWTKDDSVCRNLFTRCRYRLRQA